MSSDLQKSLIAKWLGDITDLVAAQKSRMNEIKVSNESIKVLLRD